MQTLKSFLDQSLLIWKDSTAAARFGLAILLVICIGGITGVGVWSTQPNYVILASDLAPEQAGKAIDALDTAGIAYQVKGTGSIILVDSRNLPRAQIETANLGIRSNAPTLRNNLSNRFIGFPPSRRQKST
jgi:flagellar biosynthesis/type III secretory pathway M-ring protein FliF/YscJ